MQNLTSDDMRAILSLLITEAAVQNYYLEKFALNAGIPLVT